ncbi:MAG: N-acetyltransferase [Planctomycetota bacterium]
MPTAPLIRPATVADVPAMHSAINQHAELGRMLFKSYADLYESIRNFAVAQVDGQVVGTAALAVIWRDLAEIRSLAVDAAHVGKGLGGQLTRWTLDEARRLNIRRVMSLTYEQAFFEKYGFVVVEKSSLPLKVWSDCVRCPKKDACDEIAMVATLDDVAPLPGPTAAATPKGVSIPVLP